jgi:acetyltransferase-like isoleucine patch superfamily enzyme
MEQQIQKNVNQPGQASWRQYARLVIGRETLGPLIWHEFVTGVLIGVPGAAGLWLRRKVYRRLFAACGSNLIIGRNVTLRGTSRIRLGTNVAIDDNVVLDARGPNASIEIGDGVLISRNTILRTRNGHLSVGSGSDIGTNCILATDSKLEIGKEVLVAAFTYITAGGNHVYQNPDTPIIHQGFAGKGGVTVGDDVWIGSHTTVMDGVTIGRGAVIGAHSLVNKNIESLVIAWGNPAVEQRQRG